jgi:hypothetical protein
MPPGLSKGIYMYRRDIIASTRLFLKLEDGSNSISRSAELAEALLLLGWTEGEVVFDVFVVPY